MSYRILLLGGYGIFGQRIARRLAQSEDIHLTLASRHLDKVEAFKATLLNEPCAASIEIIACDAQNADTLAIAIRQSQCQLVINASGPFQNRDYTCPITAIKNRVHYIDLADARDYVCGFTRLDTLAKRYGVLALTGASTVPALSSAVIDAMLPDFQQLHRIDVGINPGNQTPRGVATVRSILSYCGKPFLAWRDGKWQSRFGWQGLTRRRYPQPMGARWLSDCDIPDLNLFQQRYRGVKTIRFKAGLELSVLHLGTWVLSWLTRWGWINNIAQHAALLKTLSEGFYRLGSSIGGMHVELQGLGQQARPLKKTWYLIANAGDGPQVPCTAAVILAKQFQRQRLTQTGAYPCMGLIDQQMFDDEFEQFAIATQIEEKTLSENSISYIRAPLTK